MTQLDPLNHEEWQLQERALEDERRGVTRQTAEGALAQYRLIARVLREPSSDALPPDFAADVAAQVERAVELEDDRLEKWLQRVLLSVLFAAGAMVALVMGSRSMAMLSASTWGKTGSSADWIVVAALCLLVFCIVDRVFLHKYRDTLSNSGPRSYSN